MRHFRPPRPRDRRELQRIKSFQRKVGNAIGRDSEDFFEGVLTSLLQQGKIKEFRRTAKWSSDDREGGTDFFITGLDGREHRVDIKSSKFRIGKERPGIIYIVVGLHPKEKKVLRQLQKHGIVPKERRRRELVEVKQSPLRKEDNQRLNFDQDQRICSERNCPKCGGNCGSFAEYCKKCGAKLPPALLSETEVEEWLEHFNQILNFFGGCGPSLHSFLQRDPEVVFCPHCGKNLRSVFIN